MPSIEEQANACGDYYEGHPVEPDPVTPEAQAQYDADMAAWEAGFGPDGPPAPPSPPAIPGPPSPAPECRLPGSAI